MSTYAPFSRPLYVMLKPVGAACNLACTYCYYAEKARYYPQHRTQRRMSEAVLEKFIEAYLHSQTQQQVMFCWHGGEALLQPRSFYERAMQLQQQYGRGFQIENSIQTNGLLLNDDWCRFFHDHNWLVGISIDGPERFHDIYRRNNDGRPSFRQVMRGVELLNRHRVEWNALAVIHAYNAEDPIGFYRFFKEIDCHYLQFTPVVERLIADGGRQRLASVLDPPSEASLAGFSVRPAQWGHFLCTLFDEWVKTDVGEWFIQLFDATLANWAGVPPGVCSMAADCGQAGVMEYNGDVYSCDHFVFPEFKIGNLFTSSLTEMMYGPRQTRFGRAKSDTLPQQCKLCKYLFACHGECPRNRFMPTADGETGLNYLCEGYYRFFDHAAPFMDYMKNELDHQRPPAGIMDTDLVKSLLVK